MRLKLPQLIARYFAADAVANNKSASLEILV